jgi:hypothetical protein
MEQTTTAGIQGNGRLAAVVPLNQVFETTPLMNILYSDILCKKQTGHCTYNSANKSNDGCCQPHTRVVSDRHKDAWLWKPINQHPLSHATHNVEFDVWDMVEGRTSYNYLTVTLPAIQGYNMQM